MAAPLFVIASYVGTIPGLLGAALPFFNLNSLLLIVVAIALIAESVITWLE